MINIACFIADMNIVSTTFLANERCPNKNLMLKDILPTMLSYIFTDWCGDDVHHTHKGIAYLSIL